MSTRADIARRFSASAATYDRHAAVQQAVAKRLSGLLPDSAPDLILEIGCGTGIMTEHVLVRYPTSLFNGIDLSEAMVRHCKARWKDERRVSWNAIDLLRFKSKRKYPLIVSSAALHWVQPLTGTFRKIAGLLAPGGALVVALMVRGTLAELMEARMRVAPAKLPALKLPSVEDVRAGLAAAGLQVDEECEGSVRSEYPDANYMLRALHEQGLTGGLSSRGVRLLTRGELQALARDYSAHYCANGFVFATFNVYYARVHA